jgi:hypothetical protein
MAIQPIDLQTLFLRMNQIGKEQGLMREIAAQHQSLQSSQFVKETEHKDHSVNQLEDMTEGSNKTDEDGSGGQRRKSGTAEEEEKKKQLKEKNQKFMQDPDLGHHIDISG